MSNKFTMVGTEKTGQYVGVATAVGQVGFRELSGDEFRVRVEPVAEKTESLVPLFPGWKAGMGGGEYRFSTVVTGFPALCDALMQAFIAVIDNRGILDVSTGCPSWMVDLAEAVKASSTPPPWDKASKENERQQLIARVKAARLPGCNFAKRWSTDTLRRKLLEAA